MNCSLCGREIFPHTTDNRWYVQYVSWHLSVQRRKGGKRDAGKLARETGAYAHERCVDEVRAGRAVGQERLRLF